MARISLSLTEKPFKNLYFFRVTPHLRSVQASVKSVYLRNGLLKNPRLMTGIF